MNINDDAEGFREVRNHVIGPIAQIENHPHHIGTVLPKPHLLDKLAAYGDRLVYEALFQASILDIKKHPVRTRQTALAVMDLAIRNDVHPGEFRVRSE